MFLLSSTAPKASLAYSYRFTLKKFVDTSESGTTNTLPIVIPDAPNGGVDVSQGDSFTILVTNLSVYAPASSQYLPRTMLSNGSNFPTSLTIRTYTTHNAQFRIETKMVSTYFTEGYDTQGFLVNQTQFADFAGTDYSVNASAFGMVVNQDAYEGPIRFQTHIEEYYEWNSGMLLEFRASRTGISNNTIVRQVSLDLGRTSSSSSSLDYYPMFVAIIPLILLRKRKFT